MAAKSKKATRACLKKEFHKLSTPAKKRKYPYKQRVAIALSVCGVSKKKKAKK